MSDDARPKDKAFDFSMFPLFGLDLGRELGSIDSRLGRVENDVQKLDAKIDALDAKLTGRIDAVDGRVDKCLVAINRLDERTRSLQSLFLFIGGGTLVAVVAGLILQYFK